MEKNKMRNQTGLVRRGAMYHIRIKVPADLLDEVTQKSEIVRTLHTKDRREAETKLPIERVKWNREFARLRAARLPPRELKELQPHEIERYGEAYLHDYLLIDEVSRINDKGGDAYENTDAFLGSTYPDEVEEALASGDPARREEVIGRAVDHMLAKDGTADCIDYRCAPW
jgi:hypothetical protein